jgi:hypothetical protein
MDTKVYSEKLKRRDRQENPRIDAVSKWNLKKQGVNVRTGWNASGDGRIVNTVINLRVPEKDKISWPAGQQHISDENLCSVELVKTNSTQLEISCLQETPLFRAEPSSSECEIYATRAVCLHTAFI